MSLPELAFCELLELIQRGAKGGIGGYAWGAISTLLVGGGAAVAAYFLVKALHVQE